MADEIKVYMTSVSSNSEIKGQQQRAFLILEGKSIPFTKVDISVSSEQRQEMRDKCGDERAMPPRFFRGDNYLGDYEAFLEAVECETLPTFLGVQ